MTNLTTLNFRTVLIVLLISLIFFAESSHAEMLRIFSERNLLLAAGEVKGSCQIYFKIENIEGGTLLLRSLDRIRDDITISPNQAGEYSVDGVLPGRWKVVTSAGLALKKIELRHCDQTTTSP